MKKDRKVIIANALALTLAILWILCSLAVVIFPNQSMMVTNWWMHGLDMRTMGDWNLTLTNFLLGGITATAGAWLVGWLFGWSWEKVR